MRSLTLATFAALATSAFAQTGAYNTEYERLQKAYEAAIQQAIKPIQSRYADALEQLIRKASQAGDLETAVKAKVALEQLTPPAVAKTKNATTGASKRAALSANLTSGKWAVFDTPTQKRIDTQVFNPDGTCSGRLNGRWEALSDVEVKIYANAQTYLGSIDGTGAKLEFVHIKRTMRKE